tara:strand:- start:1214 stop:1453 length:240 start_codon:yes stop_codon:yes gene_type:complete
LSDNQPQNVQVFRETLPAKYEKGVVGNRKLVEKHYVKEQIIENQIIQFVDKIVEVPYDDYIIEYYTDDEDICEDFPIFD